MILYLCSSQNVNLFDYLDKEHGMPIKKMSGNFKLKQFVIHDVRNLSQFNYFMIEIKALKDSETDIIEAIAAFRAMYNARIIIFADELDSSDSLLPKLVESGVYNIITSTDIDDIKSEMAECISLQGKDIRSAIRSKQIISADNRIYRKSGSSFLCRDIKIAVVGAARKVGTTTTAINLVSFLAASGADAAYVEANSNEHMKYLPGFYMDMTVKETYIEYKSVNYYFNGNFPGRSNFIVLDFGAINQCRLQALKQCELIILCGTTKPYELQSVEDGIRAMEGLPFSIVLSHTPICAQNSILTALGLEHGNVYFTEYSPDLFNGEANAESFKDILKEYMLEEAGNKL